jgi:hypothetical protein
MMTSACRYSQEDQLQQQLLAAAKPISLDRNHNGYSEAAELQNVSASAIRIIELKYKESRRKDANGNWFRYRAVTDANGTQAGRWAWDVFLQKPG